MTILAFLICYDGVDQITEPFAVLQITSVYFVVDTRNRTGCIQRTVVTAMPNVSPLQDLALLYLAMVHDIDDDLSYAEREAVTDTLHGRYAYLDRAEVQNVVLEVLARLIAQAAQPERSAEGNDDD